MAIIDMKKITLIALEEERDKIVSLLQNLSNVEVTDGKILLNEEEWEGMVHAQELGQDINLLDDKIADLQFAIGFLRKYDETKKGMFGGKHVLSFQEYQSVIDKEDKILEGVAECRRLDRELSDLRNQETRLHNIIRQMESWKALSLPLEEVHDTRETVIAIGVLPLDQTIPFQEQLLSLDPPCYFDLISQDNEQSYGLLVYHKGDREIMQERLKEFGWNTVAFPNLSGTPGGIIQSRGRIENHRSAADGHC